MKPQLAAALVKRVQSCGTRPVTAAKTLLLLHRIALAGGGEEVLAPATGELGFQLERRALPPEEHAHAECVPFLKHHANKSNTHNTHPQHGTQQQHASPSTLSHGDHHTH